VLENLPAVYSIIIVFFNHVKDSLTLTLTGFVLDMISNTITKPYPAWQKSWKFFVAILGNFILQLTDWGNYFQAFNNTLYLCEKYKTYIFFVSFITPQFFM